MKTSLCKLILLTPNIGNIKYGHCLYSNDIKEIKRKYPGQTYIYYPINIIHNKIELCYNPNNAMGYIVVSKRDFKLGNAKLRYLKSDEIKNLVTLEVNNFINLINM